MSASRSSRILLAGIEFDRLSEQEVVDGVIGAIMDGRGGWIVTPNVDICQAIRRDPALASLVATASFAVLDGMPLVWAARMAGGPPVERVTGASLIFSLTEAAAKHSMSVYFLGGRPGVAEEAGERLARRFPGLLVAGAYGPPMGFESDPRIVDSIRSRLTSVEPAIVYVGFGFPKQEILISQLATSTPNAWFVACGAAIPFAAGAIRRAPSWMQGAGLEWLYRLSKEPRRLFTRYIIRDLPFACGLLIDALLERWGDRFKPG